MPSSCRPLGRAIACAATALLFGAGAARGQGPSLFCHQAHAPAGRVSVPQVHVVDRFGAVDSGVLRTAHVCKAATVDGIPSALPEFDATTFELAAGTPQVHVGDFLLENQFGHAYIHPEYADLLLTNALVGGGTTDPLPALVAWTCYRLEFPAFPNFYVAVEDLFRSQKLIRIRKPRLLCVPTQLDGTPPDPDSILACYRQVPKLPAPPELPVLGLAVRTPFALETLDAGKDDLVCLPSTITPAPPGSAGDR